MPDLLSTPPRALVLSGGGTRLSFEAGALQFLYTQERIAPRIFVGTSAGAVVAAVLAQHRDPADQWAALAALVREFGAYTSPDALLQPEPGARGLLAALRALDQHASATEVALALGLLAPLVRPDATAPAGGHPVRSLFLPGPGMIRATSAPIFDAEAVLAAGNTLRVSVVGLESGALRFVAEDGSVRSRRDEVLAPAGSVDVGAAILASCALPGIFPPVPLAGELYLDGGMRAFLPAALALDHLGAGVVHAIATRPAGVPAAPGIENASLFGIIARTHGHVAADESLRDELDNARARGAVVVTPLAPVHDIFQMDAGLYTLSIDDGWMAAAARCRNIEGGAAHAADITALRGALLRAEREDRASSAVAALREQVRVAVAAAPAGLLPPRAAAWGERTSTDGGTGPVDSAP